MLLSMDEIYIQLYSIFLAKKWHDLQNEDGKVCISDAMKIH